MCELESEYAYILLTSDKLSEMRIFITIFDIHKTDNLKLIVFLNYHS